MCFFRLTYLHLTFDGQYQGHTTNTNVSLMVTIRANMATVMELYVHLTLANSYGQGRGHAHFECEYLVNGIRKGNVTIAIYIALSLENI